MIAIIREKMRKLLPVLCGIVILFFMIYPYAKSASYSVFQGDDFSKAIFMKGSEQSLIHHLELCIKLLKQNYLERLGFYTSIILLGLFSPVNNLGLHGLGIVMFTNVWLYYLSILLCVYNFLKRVTKKSMAWIGVFICLVYELTAYVQAQESFYQLFCATTYTIPMSFMLIGVSCFLIFLEKRKYVFYIFGILCGIIGCGGSLVVPALGCSIMLLILIYIWLTEKKVEKCHLIWFGIWLFFSLVNTLSPGNFARHAQIDESGIHPIRALTAAFMMVYKKRYLSLGNTDWMAIILIFVLIGMFIIPQEKLDKKNYAIVSCMALMIPFIVAFPVSLGYSNFNTYYACPRRVAQIIDLTLMLTTGNAAVCAGHFLRCNAGRSYKSFIILVCIGACVALGMDNYSSVENNASIKIINGLRSGVYEKYNEQVVVFLDSLSGHEGEEVVVSLEDYPRPIEEFYCIELSKEPDGAADNVNLAKYYGLKSIVLTSEEE